MLSRMSYFCLVIMTIWAVNSQLLQYDGYIETSTKFNQFRKVIFVWTRQWIRIHRNEQDARFSILASL